MVKNSKPHIIQKLQIELNLPESELPQQNELSAKVKSGVLSGLDRFERRTRKQPDDDILRLEQLSVVLNVQTGDLDVLEVRIVEALLTKIAESKKRRRKEKNRADIFEKSPAQKRDQDYEQLMTYLKTGTFPWWASAEDSLVQIEKQLKGINPSRLKNELMVPLGKNTSSLARLAMQFSEKTIFELIQKLVSGSDYLEIKQFIDVFRRFIRETEPPVSSGKLHRTERLLFYEALGYAAGVIRDKKELLRHWTTIIFDFVSAPGQTTGRPVHPWSVWLDSSAGPQTKEWLTFAKSLEKNRFSLHQKTGISNSQTEDSGSPEVRDYGIKKLPESAEEFDVPQAGLVLLHPFITRLFGNLGLLEEGNFPGDEKRERAVCLLHYLATGEEQFDEPALALPMLLCSWPAGVPVHRFLPVSEYETEECNKVLSSVISHWNVLKGTTPDGLRENFLRRSGRLKKGSFGWTLHVEEKTQDILLDQLPWGISAVIFSWMKQHLTVQWRNQ